MLKSNCVCSRTDAVAFGVHSRFRLIWWAGQAVAVPAVMHMFDTKNFYWISDVVVVKPMATCSSDRVTRSIGINGSITYLLGKYGCEHCGGMMHVVSTPVHSPARTNNNVRLDSSTFPVMDVRIAAADVKSFRWR
jgi:hypothetical protein